MPEVPCPRPGRALQAATAGWGSPARPRLPPLPYLQGAGVTIDQQTEDGDLDAAGACGQSTREVCPGPGKWRAWHPPCAGATQASDHQPPTFSGQMQAQRLFLVKSGLQAAYGMYLPLHLETTTAAHGLFNRKERW